MKRETDEITHLFQSHLSNMEMPVKDNLWQDINKSVIAQQHRKRIIFKRVMTSAAIFLLIVASSAMIWMITPDDEITEAFAPFTANVIDLGRTHSEITAPALPVLNTEEHLASSAPSKKINAHVPVGETEYNDTVCISMSFTFSFTAPSTTDTHDGYSNFYPRSNYWKAAEGDLMSETYSTDDNSVKNVSTKKNYRGWSTKLGVGMSLPTNTPCGTPFNVSLTAEKRLNRFLGIESGLTYSRLPAETAKLNYLGIPLKANFYIVDKKPINLYASIGGTAEKCIAGADNNSFKKEPVQLSVAAGLGLSVNVSDKLALFVEPSVSHYFPTKSQYETLRTQRPTNFNLLCGMRINY